MDSSNALAIVEAAVVEIPVDAPSGPAAVLKGTARGLEMRVDARATSEDIVAALTARLDEAPAFFCGSDARVIVEHGPLAAGCLTQLDTLAGRFGLRIVEVTAKRPEARDRDAVPRAGLAAGSAPNPGNGFEEEEATNTTIAVVIAAGAAPFSISESAPEPILDADPVIIGETEMIELIASSELDGFDPTEAATPLSFDEPTNTAAPMRLASTPDAELATRSEGTRVVVGPVRSGVVLEHHGHLIIFGDINPGAEVRAAGNIIVLGRLRGTAHAGIGQELGFILALRLEPQQLRIGRMVARAGDGDAPTETEIAYATAERIVVERYVGKLPRNLASSL